MIRKSLNKFFKDNMTEFQAVINSSNDTILSSQQKPFLTISYIAENIQSWEIGDEKRQDNIRLMSTIYSNSLEEQLTLKNKFIRLLTTAKTDNGDGVDPQNEPGIALMGLFDLLETSDQIEYISNQIEWFENPAPVIYRDGEIVDEAEYVIDYEAGTVAFVDAQPATSQIRADYKVGFVDFNIANIIDMPITDVANITHKFNSFITLDTFFYIKRNGQKLY